jgi:hypothetical protein
VPDNAVHPLSLGKASVATVTLRIAVNIGCQSGNTVPDLRRMRELFLCHSEYILREIGQCNQYGCCFSFKKLYYDTDHLAIRVIFDAESEYDIHILFC